MKIAIGPFIGSIETEIVLFRPFVLWLQKALKPTEIIVSSHNNREFLYENFKFFPIFDDFTRNEFGQIGPLHSDVNVQDFNLILKKFKLQIQDYTKGSTEPIFHYNIPYIKLAWIPIYKRIYQNILTTPTKNNYKNKIVFIPYLNEKYTIINEVYNHLKKNYNIICCGDMKTHLPEKNILLKDPSYFRNVYSKMFEIISEASCVIVPSSHWTTIADIQGTPCFSWGTYTLQKSKKTKIVNKDIDVVTLLKIIDGWIEEVNCAVI
jgi:hypothetical protein